MSCNRWTNHSCSIAVEKCCIIRTNSIIDSSWTTGVVNSNCIIDGVPTHPLAVGVTEMVEIMVLQRNGGGKRRLPVPMSQTNG